MALEFTTLSSENLSHIALFKLTFRRELLPISLLKSLCLVLYDMNVTDYQIFTIRQASFCNPDNVIL
jgi:hypothetical protein